MARALISVAALSLLVALLAGEPALSSCIVGVGTVGIGLALGQGRRAIGLAGLGLVLIVAGALVLLAGREPPAPQLGPAPSEAPARQSF